MRLMTVDMALYRHVCTYIVYRNGGRAAGWRTTTPELCMVQQRKTEVLQPLDYGVSRTRILIRCAESLSPSAWVLGCIRGGKMT